MGKLRKRGSSGKKKHVGQRFSPSYKGNKLSQDSCIVYHRLIEDLWRMRYDRFLMFEMVFHVFTLIFVMAYVLAQLDITSITGHTSGLRELFEGTSFPMSTGADTLSFSSIESKADVGQFVMNVIFPKLLNPATVGLANYTRISSVNQLFWGVRFRAIDVQPNKGCAWRSSEQLEPAVAPTCYSAFSKSYESKETPHYTWQSAEETQEGTFTTYSGSYPGSGFVENILLNEYTKDALVEKLTGMFTLSSETRFIRDSTSFMIITMTLFNPNVNMIAFPRLAFEFLPTGRTVASSDIRSMPYIAKSPYNTGEYVTAVITVMLVFIRIVMVFLNLIARRKQLTRVLKRGNEFLETAMVWVFELALVALMSITLYCIIAATFVQNKVIDIQNALNNDVYDARAGLDIDWFWTSQQFYAYLVLLMALYLFKYFRLFYGLRFLYLVGWVSTFDLIHFFIVIFAAASGMALIILVMFGYALEPFSRYGAAFTTVLLQMVGYFSVQGEIRRLNLPFLTLYLILYVVVFSILLLNLYFAIILKCFGIVYNESLKDDDIFQVKNGVNVWTETKYWYQRNRFLCGKLFSGGGGCADVFRSLCCCRNHLRKRWLSHIDIIRRLREWKRKQRNQYKNFLCFEDMREALEGEAKTFRRVDNYQIDYLFSICTLTVTKEESVEVQKVIEHMLHTETKPIDYIKAGEKERKENRKRDMTNVVMKELHNVYSQFMQMKHENVASELQLDVTLNDVLEQEKTISTAIREMQQVINDINSTPLNR
mmetsp:Transcript_9674/g.15881  ORF Transcript_9674/g.15881 Transcript_9674/m.15881 type:complete len:767 (-) Transcript_9674:1099-3399(-)